MVYALIPAKDRLEFTIKCIESFKNQTYKDIKIVLIDDGSVDETVETVSNRYSDVEIIRGDGNLWCMGAFAKGVEYALKFAKYGDYVLTQNQDAYFDSNFVEILVTASEKYNNAVVGSINYSAKLNKPIYHTHILSQGVFKTHIIDGDVLEYIENSDTLNTRGTLFPIEVLKKIGNFSPLFPHYAGDYEITCRAKKYGYKLIVASKAISYSHDDNLGLSKRIKLKKKKTFKDMIDLFFSKRSSSNIYYSTLLTLISVPFPDKFVGIARIWLISTKMFVYDYFIKSVIFGWKN